MAAKWLDEHESRMAVERLRANRTGIINREWKWYQVREALNPLVDPTGWLLFWLCIFNETVNGGVSTFKTLIINAIGWNQFQSALVSAVATSGGRRTVWHSVRVRHYASDAFVRLCGLAFQRLSALGVHDLFVSRR